MIAGSGSEADVGDDGLPSRSFSEGWSGALQGNGAGLLSDASIASCKTIGSWYGAAEPLAHARSHGNAVRADRRIALGCLRCLL
jgi:hypothetical protein